MQFRLSRSLLLVCLACPMAAAVPTSADTVCTASTRAGIQTAYNQICADFEQRNIDGAMTFFAPDFFATDEHGKLLSRDEIRRQYLDLNNTITSLHSDWTLGGLTPVPGGVQAEMDMHSDGTGRKKVLFFHVNGTFTSEMRVRDLWEDTAQGWRIKRRIILLHQTETHPA